jgi:hypothetical protein
MLHIFGVGYRVHYHSGGGIHCRIRSRRRDALSRRGLSLILQQFSEIYLTSMNQVVNVYMAKAPTGTDVSNWDGSGNVWFKVSIVLPDRFS